MAQQIFVVRAIYYIFDPSDGKGYVGSAYGSENLLQRWLGYAATGHGANPHLKMRDRQNFQFTILERVLSAAPLKAWSRGRRRTGNGCTGDRRTSSTTTSSYCVSGPGFRIAVYSVCGAPYNLGPRRAVPFLTRNRTWEK